QTKMWVRIPAGRFLNSRSKPTRPDMRIARKIRKIISTVLIKLPFQVFEVFCSSFLNKQSPLLVYLLFKKISIVPSFDSKTRKKSPQIFSAFAYLFSTEIFVF